MRSSCLAAVFTLGLTAVSFSSLAAPSGYYEDGIRFIPIPVGCDAANGEYSGNNRNDCWQCKYRWWMKCVLECDDLDAGLFTIPSDSNVACQQRCDDRANDLLMRCQKLPGGYPPGNNE